MYDPDFAIFRCTAKHDLEIKEKGLHSPMRITCTKILKTKKIFVIRSQISPKLSTKVDINIFRPRRASRTVTSDEI